MFLNATSAASDSIVQQCSTASGGAASDAVHSVQYSLSAVQEVTASFDDAQEAVQTSTEAVLR